MGEEGSRAWSLVTRECSLLCAPPRASSLPDGARHSKATCALPHVFRPCLVPRDQHPTP